MAAQVKALPQPDERCVVMGTMAGEDGRKAFTLTTLYDEGGQPLACATATWVALA
jgi:hypothetical protein